MKRITLLYSVFALLFAATACTQDDADLLSEETEGIPMTFTATGLTPPAVVTFATVDGDWADVTSVAVQIGSEVKAYRVTHSADNLTATLNSDDPHYWKATDTVTVSAWWPYTEGETAMPAVIVQADQRGNGYAKSDHIAVMKKQLSYNEGTSTLDFTHRTARVSLTLSGSTSDVNSVRLTNLSTADGNPGEIIARDAGSGTIYEALVAPQSVAQGTAFVSISTAGGKTYVYRMQADTEWTAGSEYSYAIAIP